MSSINGFDHLRIPLEDIKRATDNFDSNNLIGGGGFGKVYRGKLVLSQRPTNVALKRLDVTCGQGAREFWKEIMTLSLYKHENVVALLGFCDEKGEKILVYEYLTNKSLDIYLSSVNLSWIERLHICIGSARGLQYLHSPLDGTLERVVHRDIKSANILLDENWNVKISDFGLSKLSPANHIYSYLFSNGVGTIGYCDPLYWETGYLTKESDVYSFGVVLFEVLCGRPCYDNHEYLPILAKRCYQEKKLGTIILPSLKEQISPQCLDKFSTIAYQCLHKDRTERPSMITIVKELETALRIQTAQGSSDVRENKQSTVIGDVDRVRKINHALTSVGPSSGDHVNKKQEEEEETIIKELDMAPHFQKTVSKVDCPDAKTRRKIFKSIVNVSGLDSMSLDKASRKLTLIGDVDPVEIVSRLRKICHAEIISVGEEGKKESR